MTKQHWLRANETTSTCWALFEECAPEQMYVLAVVGATGLVDRVMTRQEAREQWKKLVSGGWHKVAGDELKQAPSRHQLTGIAYD